MSLEFRPENGKPQRIKASMSFGLDQVVQWDIAIATEDLEKLTPQTFRRSGFREAPGTRHTGIPSEQELQEWTQVVLPNKRRGISATLMVGPDKTLIVNKSLFQINPLLPGYQDMVIIFDNKDIPDEGIPAIITKTVFETVSNTTPVSNRFPVRHQEHDSGRLYSV